MDFNKLQELFENGSREELENFCEKNDLIINNGKIFHKNINTVEQQIEYWDKRQHVKKINLNS